MKKSAWVLLVILAAAIVGPWFSPHDYLATNFDATFVNAPSVAGLHLFGTDDLGRDLFVRTMLGIRVTLLVAVVASAVSLAYRRYLGGGCRLRWRARIDAVMMRAVDTLYALPFIFFVILLMVTFERNFLLIFVAIGAINWLDMARIVRGQTLSLKEREFVQAARLTGVSPTTNYLSPHRAEPRRHRRGLCNPDDSAGNTGRVVSEFSRARHPGAANLTGFAGQCRCQSHGRLALATVDTGDFAGGDPDEFQFPR